MEYRLLGGSGLKVSALSFGVATFGGTTEFFKAWGETDVAEARRLIDICFEAGVNLFATANVSTKATFRRADGPNDLGSSPYHLRNSLEASLRRLGTDYVDIYHLHGFDAL